MTVNEYTHLIIKNFILTYPSAHKSMQQISHNEPTLLSDWHLEGSVWTHTMMVLLEMSHVCETVQCDKPLLLTALLHDIGKICTREVNLEKKKVTFYGHPGVSTFIARDILDAIDSSLTREQKIRTLRLINYHQILFNVTNEMSDKASHKFATKFASPEDYLLLNDIQQVRVADCLGRISTYPSFTGETKIQQLTDSILETYLENTNAPSKEKPEAKAIILVGLPGAGKSTYVEQNLKSYTLVSRDAQVEHLAKGLPYSEAFNTVNQTQVDILYENDFSDALKKQKNIVVDKTNLTYKSRMKSITRLKAAGYDVEIVVLMPSSSTIYTRNTQREGKRIPQKVIRRMMTTFEMPFHTEGAIKYIFHE